MEGYYYQWSGSEICLCYWKPHNYDGPTQIKFQNSGYYVRRQGEKIYTEYHNPPVNYVGC